MRRYAITLIDGVSVVNVVEAYGDEASYDTNGEKLDFVIWADDAIVLAVPREHIAYIMSYPDERAEVNS